MGDDTTATITVSQPVYVGEEMVITYTGATGTVLQVRFNNGDPTNVTVGSDGKARITVPGGATTYNVHDSSGAAADASGVVLP